MRGGVFWLNETLWARIKPYLPTGLTGPDRDDDRLFCDEFCADDAEEARFHSHFHQLPQLMRAFCRPSPQAPDEPLSTIGPSDSEGSAARPAAALRAARDPFRRRDGPDCLGSIPAVDEVPSP
jgi:hypothetical protein